ncbi:2-dehydro-3-deoxy-6-phosphogalactonate aldolase [Granulosicoccaceae sp. 1_MG-2023]|nr:2-dehydro-3-deoxy-6-phosphogalactonate aldolase [Granulosicoccaceae sp. 1_MG-2023]
MVAVDERLDEVMADLPLIAILRGITPDEVIAVADALCDAGLWMIEVPLNSPDAFESIAALVAHCPDSVLVGAGTVLQADQACRLAEMGARLLVTPNTDPAVVSRASAAGLISAIGCMTPSEAFSAVHHGASMLKVFPAGRLAPAYASDIKAVLPAGTRVLGVGAIGADDMARFVAGGYDGFGLGSALYAPGRSAQEVGERARDCVAAWRALQP